MNTKSYLAHLNREKEKVKIFQDKFPNIQFPSPKYLFLKDAPSSKLKYSFSMGLSYLYLQIEPIKFSYNFKGKKYSENIHIKWSNQATYGSINLLKTNYATYWLAYDWEKLQLDQLHPPLFNDYINNCIQFINQNHASFKLKNKNIPKRLEKLLNFA